MQTNGKPEELILPQICSLYPFKTEIITRNARLGFRGKHTRYCKNTDSQSKRVNLGEPSEVFRCASA